MYLLSKVSSHRPCQSSSDSLYSFVFFLHSMCLLNFYSSGQTKISSTQAEHFIKKPLSSADLYRKWAFFWWASLALWCGKLERDLFCLQSGGGLVAKSCPTLCDPMNCVACQVPLSMGFSIQEYWVGLPFPSPGNLPNPGIEPSCPALQAILYCQATGEAL